MSYMMQAGKPYMAAAWHIYMNMELMRHLDAPAEELHLPGAALPMQICPC